MRSISTIGDLITDNDKGAVSVKSVSGSTWTYMGRILVFVPRTGRLGIMARFKNRTGSTSTIKWRFEANAVNYDAGTASVGSNVTASQGVSIGSLAEGLYEIKVYVHSTVGGTIQLHALSWGFTESAN